mgnify:CR=1 FL=1
MVQDHNTLVRLWYRNWFRGFDCHILGYNIRVSDSNLIKFCNDIQYFRKIRLQRIITYLQDTFNLSITSSEIDTILSKTGSISSMILS